MPFSNNLTVLLGNGSGGFTEAEGSPIAGASAVVGDFNGDGIQDLVAHSGNNVTVLLGNGSGDSRSAQLARLRPRDSWWSEILTEMALRILPLQTRVPIALSCSWEMGWAGLSRRPVARSRWVRLPLSHCSSRLQRRRRSGPVVVVGGDHVTVLLGNGSGGFTEAPGSPLSTGADFIAVGDFQRGWRSGRCCAQLWR